MASLAILDELVLLLLRLLLIQKLKNTKYHHHYLVQNREQKHKFSESNVESIHFSVNVDTLMDVKLQDGQHYPYGNSYNKVHEFLRETLDLSSPYGEFPEYFIKFGNRNVSAHGWEFPDKLWTDGFHDQFSIKWPAEMLLGNNSDIPLEQRPEKMYFSIWKPAQRLKREDVYVGENAKLSEFPPDCNRHSSKVCARNYSWYDSGWIDTFIWTPKTRAIFDLKLVMNITILNPYSEKYFRDP